MQNNWVFQATLRALKSIKWFEALNGFVKKFDFLKQFISAVKIFIFSKLLHRRIWFPIFFMRVLSQFLSFETLRFFRLYLRQINSRKNWVFWGSFSSYGKSKFFQLGHRFNRFAKSLSFLTNLSELWNVFKFLSKLPEQWKLELFQVTS